MAKSLKESPNSNLHIPAELVLMMPKNLPTKFLLQMKSVCKTCISDRRFIKKHLDAANDAKNLSLKRYMFDGQTMESMGLEDKETRYEHTIPITSFSQYVEILGSCNGLLLLGDDDRSYYLWNPSTRLLRNFNGPYILRGQFRNFALGYDSTSSAYKVVRIVRVTSNQMKSNKIRAPLLDSSSYDATKAHVYNCKTDCWKKIEDFPYVIFENAQGVTMNGYPHWVMFRDHFGQDEAIDLVIVYFDLANEEFKEIPKPKWLVPSSVTEFEFGVFEGQLCFIHFTKRKTNIWVMKKHGESWINVSSLLDITKVRLPGWSSGHRVCNIIYSDAFERAQYVESLVSPYGGNDMIG